MILYRFDPVYSFLMTDLACRITCTYCITVCHSNSAVKVAAAVVMIFRAGVDNILVGTVL